VLFKVVLEANGAASCDWLARVEERTRYAGLVLRDELYPAPEPLTDEASKVGALPQTPPGAEPLDLNTCARFR
jgi:hypothetical protein